MTDDGADGAQPLPTARRIRTRWPGLVWAIPLAAFIFVAFLGGQAFLNRGLKAVVTVASASGVSAGDTKVMVQGVEAGHVTHVRISRDGRHVDLTLSLDPRERSALNSNTRFWLLGAKPSLTNIASVKAAISGAVVGMSPGKGGTPTNRFTALEQPPVVLPGTRGQRYHLTARDLGPIQPGASLVYHGQEIGKVERTALKGPDLFTLDVFVFAPYDGFIRQGTQFWSASPLRVSFSGGGVSAGLSSPGALLNGGIQVDLPESARADPLSPAGSTFTLYDDQGEAAIGPTGPQIPYELVLTRPAGDLQTDAPVFLQGFKVGRVVSARLEFAPQTRRPYTLATIALFPLRLHIGAAAGAAPADLRRSTDVVVSRLLGQGYRAGLAQVPPLIGGHIVVLAAGTGGAAALSPGVLYPRIPAASGGADAEDLMAKADSILTKVDDMPIAEIGSNVRALTANLKSLTGAPEVRDSLVHLDHTLAQLDSITATVKPRVGPLLDKLGQTADQLQATASAARGLLSGEGASQDQSLPEAIGQLDQAARSIRALTDYLGRHPEALIRGKAKEKK